MSTVSAVRGPGSWLRAVCAFLDLWRRDEPRDLSAGSCCFTQLRRGAGGTEAGALLVALVPCIVGIISG